MRLAYYSHTLRTFTKIHSTGTFMKPQLPMKQSVIALSVLSAISVTSLSAIAQDSEKQRADNEQKKIETIQVSGRSLE